MADTLDMSGAWSRLAWRMARAGLLGLFLPVLAARAEVPPDAATMPFDIPAQALDAALTAYTQTTGLAVLVASGLTAGRRAVAVRGHYAPREALRRLLADTPLEVRYTSDTAFTLVAPEAAPAATSGTYAQAQALLMAYAGTVQSTLTRSLCHWQGEAFGRYRAGLELWIDRAGKVDRARLLGSTGDDARDADMVLRLRGLVMDAPPPADLPQPLTLLLTRQRDPAAICRAVQRTAQPLLQP